MARTPTHNRLLDLAQYMLLEMNSWKVEEGELTEDELLSEASDRIEYMKTLPFTVFTKRLLAEIPEHYFGNT